MTKETIRSLLACAIVCTSPPLTTIASAPSAEATAKQAILDASDKPIVEFVTALNCLPPSDLPPPGTDAECPYLADIRDMLWLRAFEQTDCIVAGKDKEERIAEVKALTEMYLWLVAKPSYSNLAIASHIGMVVSRTVMASVLDDTLAAQEARHLLESISQKVEPLAIVEVARAHSPPSRVLDSFLATKTIEDASGLATLANQAYQERTGKISEFGLGVTPFSVLTETAPEAFIHYVAGGLSEPPAALELLRFIERGGDVDLDASTFRSSFAAISPESLGERNPISLVVIEPETYLYFVETFNEWRDVSPQLKNGLIQLNTMYHEHLNSEENTE